LDEIERNGRMFSGQKFQCVSAILRDRQKDNPVEGEREGSMVALRLSRGRQAQGSPPLEGGRDLSRQFGGLGC